jgi:glycosyltransferase involved in cell wall biosynthesis
LAPFFSVVIPVLNGGAAFRTCLSALDSSSFQDWELIVVDDGSTDGSDRVALAVADRVLSTSGFEGPAAARNLGSEDATGEYLFFIDADCSVHSDTLAIAAEKFRADPNLEALFGSYDDRPTAPGIVARFKNLQHHHVHQSGEKNADTFWAGCGSIRRSRFLELKGFDAERFERPSIEDIELGYRIKAEKGRILLAKDVQVTHHKAWSLGGLIRTDLFDRGIPWVVLLSQNRGSNSALNLSRRGRLSVILGSMTAVGLVLSAFDSQIFPLVVATAVGFVLLNLSFYRLLLAKGGLKLLISGMALHWVYQIVCVLAFVLGKIQHWRAGSSTSRV